VSVDTDLVEPFLPPGERVHQLEDEAGAIIWYREASVDGEDVFRISRESWEPGWSTRRFAVGHACVGPEHEATDKS
jgi:hypothetical protein